MTFPSSGGTSDDLIDSEDHLGSLGSREESLFLDSEAFSNTECLHVINVSLEHVEASGCITVEDFASQVLNDFSTVVASIISNDGRELL